MKIETARQLTNEFIEELLRVWEASVRATHHFLTEDDISSIKPHVRQAFITVDEVMYTVDERGSISGFMVVVDTKIEMLFIHPNYRGHGIGTQCIDHAVHTRKASLVDVNEQNIQGLGFYTHMGFKVVNRFPLDESGNPFPILRMSR